MAGRNSFWPLWLAAVAVPLVGFVLAAGQAWQQAEADTRDQLERRVAVLHEHALRAFETQEALLAAMQWHTASMGWAEIRASAEVAAFIDHLVHSTPGTGNLGMVAPDGRIAQIGLTPFPPPPVDFSDREYVRHQRGPHPGPHISLPLVGRLNGRANFNYSRPRLDAAGEPDGGVIWSTFRPSNFSTVYARMAARADEEVALVRTLDGAVLAGYPAQEADPPRSYAAVLASVAGGGPARLASPLDGRTRLYQARRLNRQPVAVVHGVHPARTRAAWWQQVGNTAAVSAAAMLVLLWLTWLVQARTRGEAVALQQRQAEAERRAEAEALLRQHHRLEALGQVAAGVAHDFRNTIHAVQGGAALARKALDAADIDRARRLLAMIAESAGRGAALTERMLHVARRTPAGTDAEAWLDPVAAVAAAAELLGRTMPPGYPIRLEVEAAGLPARVRGHAGELEAALLNIAANARDAMPGGGTITIRLDAAPGWPEAPGGAVLQARITVRDCGVGMDAATLARVAEPFFTTKPAGQGTGLGLASVRAFAQGAGGVLEVTSPGPGQGCTVTLWLPAAEDVPKPAGGCRGLPQRLPDAVSEGPPGPPHST